MSTEGTGADEPPEDRDDPFAMLSSLLGGVESSGNAGPLAGLLEQAQAMQAGMEQAQAELASSRVEGSAGGGLVTATMTGTGDLLALRIDPSVVDPADVETLADLVVAAVRVGAEEARRLGEESVGAAIPGLPDIGALTDSGVPADPGVLRDDRGVGILSELPDLGPDSRPAGDAPDDDDIGPAGGPAGGPVGGAPRV